MTQMIGILQKNYLANQDGRLEESPNMRELQVHLYDQNNSETQKS